MTHLIEYTLFQLLLPTLTNPSISVGLCCCCCCFQLLVSIYILLFIIITTLPGVPEGRLHVLSPAPSAGRVGYDHHKSPLSRNCVLGC